MNNDIISSIPCAVNQALITLSNRVFNLTLGLTPIELELKDIPIEEMTFILNFLLLLSISGPLAEFHIPLKGSMWEALKESSFSLNFIKTNST